jgi:hypothetical protein
MRISFTIFLIAVRCTVDLTKRYMQIILWILSLNFKIIKFWRYVHVLNQSCHNVALRKIIIYTAVEKVHKYDRFNRSLLPYNTILEVLKAVYILGTAQSQLLLI